MFLTFIFDAKLKTEDPINIIPHNSHMEVITYCYTKASGIDPFFRFINSLSSSSLAISKSGLL